MSRNNYNSDFSYWEELLLDYTNFAKVPNDYFNESYDFDIVEESICFSDEISRGLSNFLNRYEINFEVFFMLIYGLILEKYTYEEDVVFGVTKDVLPIRVNYTNKMSFLESLKLLQNQYLNTLEKYSNSSRNKELFLEYLNNKSALKDKLINTVLFWNDKDEYRFVSNDLNVKIDFSYENTKVHLIYNANVYSVEKIRRILNMFEGITKQVLENENIDVCRLKFISDEEKKRILTHFDDTKKDYDFEKDYISLFRKSATDYAYNIAVEDDNHFMSYKELDLFTDKLGGYLNHIGVKKEDVVAVMLPRNINFVIAAIATMKAGGSFFPIDINNPIERIEYLLEDSKAKVLIKEDNIKISLREESIKDSNICVVDIEKDGFMDTDFPLTQEIKPENVAYTISTSGSTGRPKIISVEHRSLLNMCFYSIDQINITENDICGVYLSFSFDAVMKQIFPYLLKGATVSIMSEEAKFNEFTVNEFCEENDVTVLALPSALAKLFIKNCNNQSLRVLQAGGEKLNGYKKRKYKLYNEYGPAEFTVLSTQFLVDKEYNRIPIGKPIANTYVYVLDKYDNLCPIGVPGELCLSGAQISRGYINKKEATEKSFVDNPFCIDVYTKKMYRSGDLVTWLETGELDYIGRLDNQIKIGENNIDLYEIDNMISNINQIKSCITIAKEDEKGIKYLSSYYVIDEKDYEKINSTYIRNYLKLHLPSYMIPSVIIRIEKIPVTLIGKVNKRALN